MATRRPECHSFNRHLSWRLHQSSTSQKLQTDIVLCRSQGQQTHLFYNYFLFNLTCLLQDIPPRFWFEALERTHKNNIATVKQNILKTIENVVAPGSILVARRNATLCSFQDLQQLSHLYPTIVSTEALKQHDNNRTTTLGSLETIWKLALDVCEEAQHFDTHQLQNFMVSQMWCRRFGSECFEMILHQLTG